MPWWGWLLLAVGVTSALAYSLRRQVRFGLRVAKALATDDRLPKPLRWALRVALAIKVVPFPDLGIDEAVLVVVGVLLVTVYRPTLKAILADLKLSSQTAPEPGALGPEDGTAPQKARTPGI